MGNGRFEVGRCALALTASGGPLFFFRKKKRGEKKIARSSAARGWHSANSLTGRTGSLRLQRESLFSGGVLDGTCAVRDLLL